MGKVKRIFEALRDKIKFSDSLTLSKLGYNPGDSGECSFYDGRATLSYEVDGNVLHLSFEYDYEDDTNYDYGDVWYDFDDHTIEADNHFDGGFFSDSGYLKEPPSKDEVMSSED